MLYVITPNGSFSRRNDVFSGENAEKTEETERDGNQELERLQEEIEDRR